MTTTAEEAATEKKAPKSYDVDESARALGIQSITDTEDSETEICITVNNIPYYADLANSWKKSIWADMTTSGFSVEQKNAAMQSLFPIASQKRTIIKQVIEHQSKEGEKEAEGDKSFKNEFVCKYSGLRKNDKNAIPLYESVIIQGKPLFAGYHPITNSLDVRPTITDVFRNYKLSPYVERSHAPYEFRSLEELKEYMALAKRKTLGELWCNVYYWVNQCYNTDNKYELGLITSLIIYSYFVDVFGITPYLFLHGESTTGKGPILKIMELLGYRFSGMSLGSAASVYRLLGDVEAGQVSMFMDEANSLDQNLMLVEACKLGYVIDATIPRNFDVMSAESASMKFFFPFCLKVFAAERLPNPYIVGGFMTRTFFIDTFFGIPALNIKEIAANPDKPHHAEILNKIAHLRKLLFAWRLMHFADKFDDIDLRLVGRHRELSIGTLTLFGNTDVYDIIKQTFYKFIEPQITAKTDQLSVYMATLIKHLGKAYAAVQTDEDKKKDDGSIIHTFADSFKKELRNEQDVIDGKITEEFKPIDATECFTELVIPSDLIWDAIIEVLPGAKEVDYGNDREEHSSSSSNDKSNKKKGGSSNSRQKAIVSELYSDISWQRSLPKALRAIGGSPSKKHDSRNGKRAWVFDSRKITRFENSFRKSSIEVESVLKNKDINKELNEKIKQFDFDKDTADTQNSSNSIDSTFLEENNKDISGNGKSSMVNHEGDVSANTVNIEKTDVQNTLSLPSEVSQLSEVSLSKPPQEVMPQQEQQQQEQSNQQQLLLLQKPNIMMGNGSQEALFFGKPWVSWDLEWHPRTSVIYAASFVNYKGETLVHHIKDPQFEGDEGKLLDAIVYEILKYPVSFAYYSTGMQDDNTGKGKDSDLVTLAMRLGENTRVNVIGLKKPQYGYGRPRPVFKEYCNHTHIDIHSIFSNAVIKNFIPEEYEYRTEKLHDVSMAFTGTGKLSGLDGVTAASIEDAAIQRNYVLWDSVCVHNIKKTKICQDVFELLNEVASAMPASLEWVCHTTTTSWWTKILDDMGCERPKGQVKEDYKGALVLDTKAGYYQGVTLVDANSLYPTMSIIHNIGHNTVNCNCCFNDPLAKVPRYALIDPKTNKPIDKEYWICRKEISAFRRKLVEFRDAKNAADASGQKMKKQCYKLIMNSGYGTWAAGGHPYLCPSVAELIVGFGRYTLKVMNAVALAMGLGPIAGDTDSLFLTQLKTKEQFDEFLRRCQALLLVHDPVTGEEHTVDIGNKTYSKQGKDLPITFTKFWNIAKKHYYAIDTEGKYQSTKLEIEKDDRIPYSSKVLFKQWQADLESGSDPIPNLQRLTSDAELRSILKTQPELLMNSALLREDPGYLNANGQIIDCTYANPNLPQAVIAREQGLRKGDVASFFKAGSNNKRKPKLNEQGIPIGTYTINPKYANLNKIKDDLANAWMDVLKVYLGHKIEADKDVETKIKKEVFNIGD